jgi:NAD(P)-dependent dehydrogenase (short-subunit alcohol dehydrogenase family)
LLTRELARRLEGSAVTANCAHRGLVRTRFGREAARDDTTARRLWQLSEELTGLTPGTPHRDTKDARTRTSSSGYGLVIYIQPVPFQCRMRVWYPVPVEALAVKPTAHAFDEDVAATELRMLCWDAAVFGLAACCQAVPFQCATRVW